MTYQVVAKRWKHGWELHIAAIGVTQSRRLSDAEPMVRDYIALDLDVAPDSFAVVITPELGDEMDARVLKAKQSTRAAIDAQRTAAEQARHVARALHAQGLTGRDIARVLEVSPQRASQLLAG